MSIERALLFNTAALALTGAVFLALGHQNTVLPLVLAVATFTAIGLTDFLHWLQLNRIVANFIAIVAVAWSLRDFFDRSSDGQLLAIANMLVYLQLVLLFQEKNARVYWQLVVLSLLQVVVAAAMDLGPQFGVLLAVYTVLMVSALVLLCILRESQHEGASPPRPAAPADAAWRRLLAPPSVAPAALSTEELARGFPRRTRNRQVAYYALGILLFAGVFFYLTPRLSEATWQGPPGRNATTGFVPEMRLQESGHINLGSQVVMRVSLSRLLDRKPIELVTEPYFQGIALSTYLVDERGSRWIARTGRRRPAWNNELTLVRQDIALNTAQSRALFAIWPVQELHDTPRDLRANYATYELRRVDSDGLPLARQLRYALATPSIASNRQLHALAHSNRLGREMDRRDFEAELYELTAFDSDRFPRLAETAQKALEEQDLANGPPLQRALALERHFKAPDRYRYSLHLNFPRNRDLDPIEDFVANHRTGHCEYFASALAMMLRSQGIPARIVYGYKGGDFNSLGGYYVVQQKHAHAWVEAWMAADDVPPSEIAGLAGPTGVWYRLDPTPSSRERLDAGNEEGFVRRLAQVFDYVELLWRDYVLSLNASRQQEALYDSLTQRAAAIPAFTEGRGWNRSMRRWLRQMGVELPRPGDPAGERVFNGELALVVICGLFIAFAVYKGSALVRGRLGQWLGVKPAAAVESRAPPFYQRFERMLARVGLRRRQGQTPHELAAAVAARLASRNAHDGLAQVPAELVQAYYRVRFGGSHLDKAETEAIEHALALLKPALSQAPAQHESTARG